jgi:DNA-binding MarR family transcriptional regulator
VKHTRDAVDHLIDQWKAQRPDLQSDVMGAFGRFGRIWAYATRAVEDTLGRWGLQMGDFDVLATVRRSGPPFTMAPSQLTHWLMLSPSGITSRLDRLEKLGLIERRPSEEDRRSLLIVLTTKGRKVVDEAVEAHVANQTRLLSPLSATERKTLDQILRTLLSSFEPPQETGS